MRIRRRLIPKLSPCGFHSRPPSATDELCNTCSGVKTQVNDRDLFKLFKQSGLAIWLKRLEISEQGDGARMLIDRRLGVLIECVQRSEGKRHRSRMQEEPQAKHLTQRLCKWTTLSCTQCG